MKQWILIHRRAMSIAALLVVITAATAGTVIFRALYSGEPEAVYKETTVLYGPLTVGITKEGTVSVGTVEQGFDLDISAYSEAESSFLSGRVSGGGMPDGNQNEGGSGRKLEVETVYITVGQQIGEGDPLFKLTDESVEKIRKELAADVADAELAYESLIMQQQKEEQEASQIYEQNRMYGSTALSEYEESLYELQKAETEAMETLAEGMEALADLQDDLAEVKADYEEAKKYLSEASAAVESEQETYWYLKNEESREQAKRTAEEEEDEIERLEEQIAEQEVAIISLQAAFHEASLARQQGEADAQCLYDKQVYNQSRADEIYGIATDRIAWQVRMAKEDWEDAGEKLTAFDAYITDGVVSSGYSGAITAVAIAEGDTIRNDTVIATLNDYGDVTVHVDVEDDDRKAIAVGDAVNLHFAAFPEGQFGGVVSEIGETVMDANSNVTCEVIIAVSGDVSGLLEGMSGEVTFITEETENVLSVSNRAISHTGTKAYVKVRDENGNIVQKEVVTGFSDGSSTEIREGLQEGEVVLIESRVNQR